MVCPAYQSAFIYDKEELRKRFSYFQDDSTPKVLTASKNKFLIAEETSYKKKIRSIQTIPLKPVNVVLPDSLDPHFEGGEEGQDGVIAGAELDLAARSVIDSIYIEDLEQDSLTMAEDSVYVISKDKEVRLLKYNMPDSLKFDPNTGKYVKETPSYYITEVRFNVEQDNYMWYLRDYLMLPDVRLAKMGGGAKGEEGEKASGKKKKKGGFFKNLFKKKKKKEAADSTAVEQKLQPDEDDFDYVDEDEQIKEPVQTTTEPEKKGLFKKKKKPASDTPAIETEKPAKKKKEKKSKAAKTEEETAPTEEEKPKEEEADEDGF